MRYLAVGVALACASPSCRSERASSSAGPGASAPLSAARARAGELSLRAVLEPAGVSLELGGVRVGSDCKTPAPAASAPTLPAKSDGSIDKANLSACARTLKDARADPSESTVAVTGTADAPHQNVIIALEALRSDAKGELFPDAKFQPPLGVAAPPPPPGITPRPPAAAGKAEATFAVTLSKTRLIAGDEALLSYDLAEVRKQGLPSSAKPRGQDDLFIAPLSAALLRVPAGTELAVVADATVPYRLLYEVLYTAEHSGFGKYQLLVLQKAE